MSEGTPSPLRRMLRAGPRMIAGLRDLLDDIAASTPARLALVSFTAVVVVFVILLSLPISHRAPGAADFDIVVFVAVSAVCVTGLTPVVTEQFWSDFGIGVITVAMQVGGLGILTLASIMGMAVSKRLGLRQRLIAAQATNAIALGTVGTLLRVVVVTVLTAELIVAAMLFPRFLIRGDSSLDALWHSVFYSISAFNNAGFTIHPGGAAAFADDPWILLTLALAVFVGSLGFPVILVLSIAWRRPKKWDLHTKMTLTVSLLLVVIGTALLGLFEWDNPATLGGKSAGQTIVELVFAGVMPRSGGFATMEIASMHQTSHLVLDVLMFIGGGSSSTAGGIKVTTLAVLLLAALAEARGDDEISVFGRRLPPPTIRLAVAVLLVGVATVVGGSLVMLHITNLPLDRVLFEVTSAFGTSGLTSGVSEESPPAGRYVLSILMFQGRLGTITLAAALALKSRKQLFRYPEERPIIG